jgi:hypothetical protein
MHRLEHMGCAALIAGPGSRETPPLRREWWGFELLEPQVGIEPTTARLRIECSTTELLWRKYGMPWLGFEPRRLAAPPPQDGVSTSFTTRAIPSSSTAATPTDTPTTTGATGLEPATSRVTVECSNQTELRPLTNIPHPASQPALELQLDFSRVAPTGVEPVSAP